MAHHGLIKLIVNHNLHLAQLALEWDAFVNQTHIENPQPPPVDNTLKADPSKKRHLKPLSLLKEKASKPKRKVGNETPILSPHPMVTRENQHTPNRL